MTSTTSGKKELTSAMGHLTANPLLAVRIAATGSYAPNNVVHNEDLAHLGCDAEWILQRTGIESRRRADPDTATSDLAILAARRCLQQSGVHESEVDLVIVATMTPDYLTPSTACLVQRELNLAHAGAIDMNAACSGFIYALVTGAQFIMTGSSQNVLVVGADVMSRVVDPNDVKTYPLFGDGAGAVMLGPAGSGDQDACQGILAYLLGAEGDDELLCIPGGGSREPISSEIIERRRQFLHMNGRPVFKWAVRTVVDSVSEVLSRIDLSPDDLDLVIFHQANNRIIEAAASDLGFPPEKTFVNVHKYGNTSAGSIPLALDEAYQQGRIHPGDRILLCGFGSGLAWGTCVLQW